MLSSEFLSSDMDGSDKTHETHDNEEEEEAGALRDLKRSKRNTNVVLAVFFLMFPLALVLATYFLLKARETAQFETAFLIFARETSVMADNHAENTFGQLHSLASAVRTVIAEDTGDDDGNSSSSSIRYPHEMTIPQFDMRVEEISRLTGIEMLMFVPFVPVEEKEAFEDYQLAHQDWIEEAYEFHEWDYSFHLDGIPDHIHNYTGTFSGATHMVNDTFARSILVNHTDTHEGSYCFAPVAQAGPALVDTSLIMMDMFSHPQFHKEIIASLEYNVPVVSEITDLKFLLEHIQPSGNQSEFDYSLPRSFTLDQVKSTYDSDSETVGFIVGVIQWNMLFRNFLPEYINGIIVEIVSSCGETFSYVVHGGKEDEWWTVLDQDHPYGKKYQHLQQTYKFFWKEHPKGVSKHCHFDLLITPSKEFAEEYMTNTPLIWSGIVLAGIVTVALAFLVYDRVQSKRHKLVQHEKERAEAVVSSLFPKAVKEQLLDDHAKKDKKDNFLARDHKNLDSVPEDGADFAASANPKQIAEHYESATIMFSDIAGFTSWSSAREPTDVFKLLEALYPAFDKIAKRRKVFKIETIGDCYVAVCGLPDRRKNHAVVMARFAQDCMEKFNELTTALDAEMPGTALLKLRTGLHSGSVTAGVLRGERARFQLFGDSVNTTARIETTGKPGQIHVSQQFANELIQFGKSSWLVPRNETVEAKGKGVLVTWWLQVQNNKAETMSTVSSSLRETEDEDPSNHVTPQETAPTPAPKTIEC